MILLPDLDDVLAIAGYVAGAEDGLELRERVHTERAARALQRPRRSQGQHGKFTDLAAAAAELCLALMESSFDDDPDTVLLTSYLTAKLTVQRNGRSWVRGSNDDAVVRRLGDRHREITLESFATWIEGHIGGPTDVGPAPDIYVHFSLRMSNASADDEAEIKVVCDAARKALEDFRSVVPDIEIRPLDPRGFWATQEGDEVRSVEERLLLADGLITFGVGGGSFGAGKDRDFVQGNAVPILHLQDEDVEMSRRDKTWLRRLGGQIRYYPTHCPSEHTEAIVRGHVTTWLRDELRHMCEVKRHERINVTRARPLFDMLAKAREEMPTAIWRRNLAEVCLTEKRAEDLLSDVRRFLRASLSAQLDLCAALGVPHAVDVPPTPPFNPESIYTTLDEAFDTMREVVVLKNVTADELIEVMSLAASRFPGKWSAALSKRGTLLALLREVRNAPGR